MVLTATAHPPMTCAIAYRMPKALPIIRPETDHRSKGAQTSQTIVPSESELAGKECAFLYTSRRSYLSYVRIRQTVLDSAAVTIIGGSLAHQK